MNSATRSNSNVSFLRHHGFLILASRPSLDPGGDDHLAGAFEPFLPFEGREFLRDLPPRRLASGLVEAGAHLVKRAEQLLLEAHARCGLGPSFAPAPATMVNDAGELIATGGAAYMISTG